MNCRADRRKTGFLGSLLLLGCGTSAAVPPASYVEAHARVQRDYAAQDFPAMAVSARAALTLRPDYPPMLYNLAVAEAAGGDTRPARARLSRLAAMGLHFPLADDPDFASLRGTAGFRQLVRRFGANALPAGRARVAFTLEDGHFIPEGLAWDPASGSFLVGSVRSGRIARVDRNGEPVLWPVAGETRDLSAFGMAREPGGAHLVVAYNAVPEHARHARAIAGLSGIAWLDAKRGRLRAFCRLEPPEGDSLLGDVLPASARVAYAADARSGAVYRVSRDDCRFRALVPPGRLFSPQGMAASADGRRLYIADYRGGVFGFDIETRQLSRLASPPDVTLYGIDGLYRYGGWLIGVQNGLAPHRVVALRLTRDGAGVSELRVLAANLPGFDEPTQGVVVGDRFYFIANSHWGRFDEAWRLPDGLSGPIVLELELGDLSAGRGKAVDSSAPLR